MKEKHIFNFINIILHVDAMHHIFIFLQLKIILQMYITVLIFNRYDQVIIYKCILRFSIDIYMYILISITMLQLLS